MKRQYEHTTRQLEVGKHIHTLLDEMADDRWEFVATAGPTTFIFRRSIKDSLMESLRQHMDYYMKLRTEDPSDFNCGAAHAAAVAYTIYTNP